MGGWISRPWWKVCRVESVLFVSSPAFLGMKKAGIPGRLAWYPGGFVAPPTGFEPVTLRYPVQPTMTIPLTTADDWMPLIWRETMSDHLPHASTKYRR